jgi:hypothetical protein
MTSNTLKTMTISDRMQNNYALIMLNTTCSVKSIKKSVIAMMMIQGGWQTGNANSWDMYSVPPNIWCGCAGTRIALWNTGARSCFEGGLR